MKVAVEAFWFNGAPLKLIMSICESIRSDMSQVLRIWEHGPYLQELPSHLGMLYRFEEKVIMGLISGQLTLDSPAVSCAIHAMW